MAGRLEQALGEGRFAVTAEIVPPLSADAGALIARAAPLKGMVTAVNVTDGAGAHPAMSATAAAAILLQAGFEPVLQLACRDRNRIALASDLIGAAAQGVRNLLIIHGDDPKSGDMPDAAPVHDLDSRGVMAMARAMRDEGALASGRGLAKPPAFFIGAADTPFDPPPGWTPDGLKAKIAAGAQFAQTQFCFDADVAARYMARLADHGLLENLKIIMGIGPLSSARQARWMTENLFGVTVPDAVIARLEGASDEAREGVSLCAELIAACRENPHISGVHIMAPQQGAHAAAAALDLAGLRGA